MSKLLIVLFMVVYPIYAAKINLSVLKKAEKIAPVVVIGSGPAGIAAATTTQRGGYETTIILGPVPGGQITESKIVENIPGFETQDGFSIMEKKLNHLEKFNVQVISDVVTKVKFNAWPFKITLSGGEVINALTVIIATGATPRFLGVPGEKDYLGNGVYTCAVCDGTASENKSVVIVGGGDSAVNHALYLMPYASSIDLLNRSGMLRAAPHVLKFINNVDKVMVQLFKRVVEIRGNGEYVTSLIIEDTNNKNRYEMPVGALFLAIGHVPNTGLVKNVLELTSEGYIKLFNNRQETSIPGIFAAGEVEDSRYRLVTIEEGKGTAAGVDALEFLHTHGITHDALKSIEHYHYQP